jgi:hypothetical protein
MNGFMSRWRSVALLSLIDNPKEAQTVAAMQALLSEVR